MISHRWIALLLLSWAEVNICQMSICAELIECVSRSMDSYLGFRWPILGGVESMRVYQHPFRLCLQNERREWNATASTCPERSVWIITRSLAAIERLEGFATARNIFIESRRVIHDEINWEPYKDTRTILQYIFEAPQPFNRGSIFLNYTIDSEFSNRPLECLSHKNNTSEVWIHRGFLARGLLSPSPHGMAYCLVPLYLSCMHRLRNYLEEELIEVITEQTSLYCPSSLKPLIVAEHRFHPLIKSFPGISLVPSLQGSLEVVRESSNLIRTPSWLDLESLDVVLERILLLL
jgi:hypothetical protein